MNQEQSQSLNMEHDEISNLATAADLLTKAAVILTGRREGALVDPESLAAAQRILAEVDQLATRHSDALVVMGAFIAECMIEKTNPN